MERKHYLDHLRAFLMFLGIPYHTAMIYSTNTDWLVSSVETSFLLTWVFQFTHTFRMPAFMIISGFFAMMMIRKQGDAVWLRSRFFRLGVPLVSVALLVNPWQMLARALAVPDVPDGGAPDAWRNWLSLPTAMIMWPSETGTDWYGTTVGCELPKRCGVSPETR